MNNDLLDELGYHLAVAEPAARRELFLAMTAEHPGLAPELADLLVELTLDDLRDPEDTEPAVAEDDPAVQRAMARFTAALQRQRLADPDPCPTPGASSPGSTSR